MKTALVPFVLGTMLSALALCGQGCSDSSSTSDESNPEYNAGSFRAGCAAQVATTKCNDADGSLPDQSLTAGSFCARNNQVCWMFANGGHPDGKCLPAADCETFEGGPVCSDQNITFKNKCWLQRYGHVMVSEKACTTNGLVKAGCYSPEAIVGGGGGAGGSPGAGGTGGGVAGAAGEGVAGAGGSEPIGPVTASTLGVGAGHSCAITANGGVKCWGGNNTGQLGNGTTADSSVPTDVVGLGSGCRTIAAGGSQTCIVNSSNGVQCWGANSQGQLGNNNTQPSYVPVNVPSLSAGVSGVGAGYSHSCAITSEALMCWGDNRRGQLGNHSTSSSPTPVKVSGISGGVRTVVGGESHTCAITATGALKCWGANNHGQLGNGSTSDSNVPVDVVGFSSGVVAVATGELHTCAIAGDKTVSCWGGTSNVKSPKAVSQLSSVAAIAGGQNHTCALLSNGSVFSWGSDSHGQMGNNTSTTTVVTTPVQATGLTAKAISVGSNGNHTCAITTSDGIKCWGYNNDGQVGNNTSSGDVKVPAEVVGF